MSDRVMVVDDNPAILRTVEMLLADSGYELHLARSGKECLGMLREGFRGLVLMDVMMDGMDGWDTIAAVADENLMEGNVICMLTALYDPAPERKDLKEYVLSYVRKPFGQKELLAAVEDALAHA